MGLFGNQLANVIEWSEYNEDTLFWKWSNNEIKKGSKLILKPGQDAIFLYNGKIEGVFEDDGEYDIQSDIIPFLSTLKGFKFGFNSGLRAEVIFINTKELTLKWGTKNAINIPAAGLPGGMPIRAFGTMSCKVDDYQILIEKISGVQRQYNIEDIKERVMSMLDQLLMKWIVREGKDMFNLQANAHEISSGIQSDLDLEMRKIGLSVTNFAVSSFNYPEEIKKMQEKAAAQSMVGDVNRYTQMAMADSMTNGNTSGVASDMAQMQMGMMMGQQMVNQMGGAQQSNSNTSNGNENVPKFCPNCGTKTNGAKFCPECGTKLI
ncbi:SPFH domain-containing protein [Leptotrichia sp. oral taxon 221]|uniref:SPFH domain-containing protein n=1 Tax=Leptotrichia sp. oral taxon 221 TaxID=712362 RepID=UPI001B8CAF0D|nr:SPFH domain-containing protein [Leptotrichia sp. oral taxon 221]QUB97935.1 SPFH domain-containing protein [Leptotrichia sp. oral taxon 221]